MLASKTVMGRELTTEELASDIWEVKPWPVP
jgi:hypothetical protein